MGHTDPNHKTTQVVTEMLHGHRSLQQHLNTTPTLKMLCTGLPVPR